MGKSKDSEFGASRGVDFKNVETVVNFDLPSTLRAYTHRVGRTARGGNSGTALTLVAPSEAVGLDTLVEKQARKGHSTVQPLPFNMTQIEGFRYRAEDSLKRVSRLSIRRARLQEVQTELLNADTLKSHFEENPQDLQAIKHDKVLQPARVQSHLAKVPDYLLPPALRTQLVQNRRNAKKVASAAMRGVVGHGGKRRRSSDPLRSFEFGEGGGGEGPGEREMKLKARYEKRKKEAAMKKRAKKGQAGTLVGKGKRATMQQ